MKGYDEMMFDELHQKQSEARHRLMTGKAPDEEVESFLNRYFDRNAPGSVIHYDEVPLTTEEADHIKNIMRSMYYVKVGKYAPGHFVQCVLEGSAEAIVHADIVTSRALKLFMWFKHNEINSIVDDLKPMKTPTYMENERREMEQSEILKNELVKNGISIITGIAARKREIERESDMESNSTGKYADDRSFTEWWDNVGSGYRPEPGHDYEEHAHRIAQMAWSRATSPIWIRNQKAIQGGGKTAWTG